MKECARFPRLAVALATCLFAFGVVLHGQTDATVVRGARVFTGDEVLDSATVVFRGRTIESVAPGAEVPATAGDDLEVVDGAGMTLLPGLIDSHTHNFGPALIQTLNFGVTTVLDMLSAEFMASNLRRQQAAGPVPNRADIFAGGVVTVSGGHGTQFGVPVPTLDDPEQTDSFIDERAAAGADFIKVIYEPGVFGRTLPTLDASTLPRIVEAAHRNDLLAVFHISAASTAAEAVAAGADGLVHMYFEGSGGSEFVETAREARIFMIPTLAVLETVTGMAGGSQLAADPLIADFLGSGQAAGLEMSFERPVAPDTFASIIAEVAALHAAGVPILAGTDAPNPGTTWGASIHRELELLVSVGLTPMQALRAATSLPAETFGLDDRGRIAAGLKADLLLVRGDPTADVRASRDIVAIWKDGVRFERRAAVAAPETAASEPAE